MLRIWEKFIQEENALDRDAYIKDVYASQENVHPSWICDTKGLSIQQWIDECCDILESEGHDLGNTHVDLVKEKFVKYDISVVPPTEYVQLQEALEQAKKTSKLLNKFDADSKVIEQIESTISLLTTKMKELS
tara:strand:+ start:479 stop:877 length:399 start_codon:yes stop_codon:yes gene_type:complete